MVRVLVCTVTALLVWTSITPGLAQVVRTQALASRDNMMTDRALGVSFLNIGESGKQDERGYSMSLQSTSGNIKQRLQFQYQIDR
jgi:hypothetical protein